MREENADGQSYFNPRSRTGSDGMTITCLMVTTKISTHAPAQGATCTV